MTNDEAIRELQNIAAYDIDIQRGGDKRAALKMAINALELSKRFYARKVKLEQKLRSNFSLSEATEYFALTRIEEDGDGKTENQN